MEILITICIFAVAAFILYKNINKSSKGDCNCGNCSKSCPKRQSK